MDRYEVPMESWLEPLVEAAERGDDVVIMQDGKEVARLEPAKPDLSKPLDPMTMAESLKRFYDETRHLDFPRMTAEEAAQLVRDTRDEVD